MKISRFVSWLKQAIPPCRVALANVVRFVAKQAILLFSPKSRPAMAEDLRKVGVTAIGIGLVGVLVDGASMAFADATVVLLFGVIIWVFGVWLSALPNDKE